MPTCKKEKSETKYMIGRFLIVLYKSLCEAPRGINSNSWEYSFTTHSLIVYPFLYSFCYPHLIYFCENFKDCNNDYGYNSNYRISIRELKSNL